MNNNYTSAGVVAIALLILFPIYWVGLISGGMFDSGAEFYRSAIEFSGSDILFLLVGALTVYVYLSLKRLLSDQYGFSGANLPINILIVMTCIYVFGLLSLDLLMSVFGDSLGLTTHKLVLNANLVIGIASMVVFGAADILLGAVLLNSSISESMVIKVLSIILVVQGFIEISVIFSAAVVVIFPLTMLLVALLFMQKPEVLEVI